MSASGRHASGPGDRDAWVAALRAAQNRICAAIGAVDGGAFAERRWTRPGGGGGWSRLLQDGPVIEKGGVNVSAVEGELDEGAAAAMRERKGPLADRRFFAAGLSLVIHPRNPHVPTVHANFRRFELGDGGTWWYGGGIDLTPYVLHEEDVVHFHRTLAAWCERWLPGAHPRFKAWCDRYFHLPHRGEHRGVGGVFFDDLDAPDPETLLGFVLEGFDTFLAAWLPILERRHRLPYDEELRRWQEVRRGRYVEFNLVYDRGTVFGLRTGARAESVLMSLPPVVRFVTDHEPDPRHRPLLEVLVRPRDWLA